MVDGLEGLDVGEKATVELVETKVERGLIDVARRQQGAISESSAGRA